MKVICIEPYSLYIYSTNTETKENKKKLLCQFDKGDVFSTIEPPNRNIRNINGYIQISVTHLNIGTQYESYEIVMVPKSHFLTVEELREYKLKEIGI